MNDMLNRLRERVRSEVDSLDPKASESAFARTQTLCDVLDWIDECREQAVHGGLHGLHEFASRHRDQSVQNYVAQAHRACHENPVSTRPEQEEPVDRVTEDEGQANRTGVCQTKDCWMNRTITGLPQIGSISLHDYIAMVHPGSMLASKRALLWMLFSFFVAGLLAGLLMGKVLA